jgi:membrane-bound lytic murein transglycosylase MltF
MSTVAGAAVERGVFVAGANLAQKDFRSARSTTTQSLVALNKKFVAEGKAPVKIKEAPEALEDEDILEILNAGLVAVALVDKHIADFWKQILPKLTVHDNVAVRTGGEIAWAMRKSSPQLKTLTDDFASRNKVGTATGNQLLTRYLKNTKYVKNAAAEGERKKFLALLRYFSKYGDIWFQNVEYVVAVKIGQETITSVSNTYKYYIGYRLILESRAATQEAVDKVKATTK